MRPVSGLKMSMSSGWMPVDSIASRCTAVIVQVGATMMMSPSAFGS